MQFKEAITAIWAKFDEKKNRNQINRFNSINCFGISSNLMIGTNCYSMIYGISVCDTDISVCMYRKFENYYHWILPIRKNFFLLSSIILITVFLIWRIAHWETPLQESENNICQSTPNIKKDLATSMLVTVYVGGNFEILRKLPA